MTHFPSESHISKVTLSNMYHQLKELIHIRIEWWGSSKRNRNRNSNSNGVPCVVESRATGYILVDSKQGLIYRRIESKIVQLCTWTIQSLDLDSEYLYLASFSNISNIKASVSSSSSSQVNWPDYLLSFWLAKCDWMCQASIKRVNCLVSPVQSSLVHSIRVHSLSACWSVASLLLVYEFAS